MQNLKQWLTVKGDYSSAEIFTTDIEDEALKQIITLCNQLYVQGSKIRIMPDVHAGAGCTIGTTMTITIGVCPNLVGVDIGCGMAVAKIKANSPVIKNFDLAKLDEVIKENIPSGFEIRKEPHPFVENTHLDKVYAPFNKERAQLSLGTLGGGNHFIEVNKDEEGNLYIVVHSGSRHTGLEVANYYQEEAFKQLNGNRKEDISILIDSLKKQGRYSEIESEIKRVKAQRCSTITKDLAYVEGDLMKEYLNDMKVMQHYAALNRAAMMDTILKKMGIPDNEVEESFHTIHNYIDTETMILRKGAVSAKLGEKLIIPMNMRDGSLICVGKGNKEWNYSAPHGAGRRMSRNEARRVLQVEEFKQQMKGIYSSTVGEDTLDESPMAYKPVESIISRIKDTVEILKIIKPIYNFKASDVKQPFLSSSEL